MRVGVCALKRVSKTLTYQSVTAVTANWTIPSPTAYKNRGENIQRDNACMCRNAEGCSDRCSKRSKIHCSFYLGKQYTLNNIFKVIQGRRAHTGAGYNCHIHCIQVLE